MLRPSFLAPALVVAVALAVAGSAQGDAVEGTTEQAVVTRVVDGDTIEITLDGRTDKVRLIGVDTPESVHPFRAIEYFAKEASEFTRSMVEGKAVRMAGEAGTADRDRYGRLLRYLYLEDGRLLNAEIIAEGYGFAYVKYPFGKMDEFRELERIARENGRGLWAERKGAASPAADASGKREDQP